MGNRLRDLVQGEEKVRQEREAHFFSKRFTIDNAGSLFPSCWSSKLHARGQASKDNQPAAMLHARPDYTAQAPVLEQALKTVQLTLDKNTEDGTRFRVYKIGSLQVRTT